MLVAILIALDNGLHIPRIAWVLLGLEVVGRLLNLVAKELSRRRDSMTIIFGILLVAIIAAMILAIISVL